MSKGDVFCDECRHYRTSIETGERLCVNPAIEEWSESTWGKSYYADLVRNARFFVLARQEGDFCGPDGERFDPIAAPAARGRRR